MASPGTVPNVIPPSGHQPDHHRASHDVLHAKEHAVDLLMNKKKAEFRGLMSWSGLAHERRMQKQLEEGGHGAHAAQTAEILAVTKTAAPDALRKQVDKILFGKKKSLGEYELVDLANAPVAGTFAISVEYKPKTHTYWSVQRTADEIYGKIRGMSVSELASQLGIELPTGTTATHKLTDAAAKTLAEKLQIPYLDAVFGQGSATEASIAMAKMMIDEMEQKGESILGVLKVADMSAEKEKKFRRKQLKDLVSGLQKYPGNPPELSYTDILAEFTRIQGDFLGMAAATPAAPYSFTSFAFKKSGYLSTNGLTQADKSKINQVATSELEKIEKEKKFYEDFASYVERIHDQIGRMGADANQPTTGKYGDLFVGGTPGKVNPVKLTKDMIPTKVGDELVDHFKDFMGEEEKTGEKAAAPEAPQGSDAILRIYQAYLEKKERLSPRAARERASQIFMENEFGPDEMHFIDDVVRTDVAGAKLTAFQVFGQGVRSTLKRFTSSGSDEARIARIAESCGVRFAAGEGGVINYLTSAGTYNPLRIATTQYGPLGGWNPFSWPNRLNNFLFGTRFLGVTPFARWRSRPAWGEIAGSPYKLRAAWSAMHTAMKNGEFTNSLYVQEQLIEVAHLLIAAEHQQIADGIAKMSPEDRKSMGITSVREYIMHNLHDYLEHGFAGGPNAAEQPHTVTATYDKARNATKSVGAGRRGFWKNMLTDGSDNDVDYHQAA